MLLLPLLVTALQMQSPSEDEVSRALADGIRAKLAAGWTLVDMRGDHDEVSFTLVKGKRVEAHVVHVVDRDNDAAYRIDVLAVPPVRPFAPGPFIISALAAGGGIELEQDCGNVEPRVYLLDAKAKGRIAAAKLVAETLKASVDVEDADVSANLATFMLDVGNGEHATLHVELDDDSHVIAAELRRFEDGIDVTTYEGQARMQQKIGTKVTKIESGERGVVLRGDKWFEIVPDKFERHVPPETGCGC
jgi:hypothetical protein